MAIEKVTIDQFLDLLQHHLLIDVRSPGEYNHAHIPGAYNLPLFSDDERKMVGTTYKHESRETAIKIGLDFFGPKMKKMVEEVESIASSRKSPGDDPAPYAKKPLLIYCWRGGMRSAGVAWLMDLYGFRVYTLTGGYKRFRNYVLDTFKFPFQFNILGGYTGSGKTEILKALEKQGKTVIDLEEIARHKGSAFGNIGFGKQPTQEMFENILSLELLAASCRIAEMSKAGVESIWLEDESQRIGDVNIPNDLWKTMRQAPVYFLEVPFEQRLNYIIKDYGSFDKMKLIGSILRIQKRLGSLETKKAIDFLLANNTIESFRILLKYYDKWYLKSLHNREKLNSLLINISCEGAGLQNAMALQQQVTIS
jgi:tRNA 2-selenouridine synthase